ncbi:MAG: exo-beta-N-acetylmuramidase NamZ domain-containing protein [Planctomycetota bacterium]
MPTAPASLLAPLLLAAAFSAALAAPLAAQAVTTGADVLQARGVPALAGRKVGLITNHTGRTADGVRTVDVLKQSKDCALVALFSPEHGWEGLVDDKVGNTTDGATGLVVYSLYGETRTPTDAMLQGVDTLVFDIQDIGCRSYTYISTMIVSMEAAAENGKLFVVLDRPNPIGGFKIEVPVLAAERQDFVGAHRIPLRHGMTAGELARMIVGEDGLRCDLHVVACEGWQRADLLDQTGQPWINPSPNMRRLTQALTYPGMGLWEGTNVSVGRGTDTPFEVLGAPWIDGRVLAERLTAAKLPGVAFVATTFTPTRSKHQGKACGGVHVLVTDWRAFEPVRTGVHIGGALRALFPAAWDTKKLDWLLKHQPTADALLAGQEPDAICAGWQKELDLFRLRRKPFLLYE